MGVPEPARKPEPSVLRLLGIKAPLGCCGTEWRPTGLNLARGGGAKGEMPDWSRRESLWLDRCRLELSGSRCWIRCWVRREVFCGRLDAGEGLLYGSPWWVP